MEAALGPHNGDATKSCLNAKLKDLLKQSGVKDIEYEQTKPRGKPARDSTVKDALDNLRSLIRNDRVRQKN
ncbi:MAG: hypothetical protein V3W41_15200 [Planctomycetota bacterium]